MPRNAKRVVGLMLAACVALVVWRAVPNAGSLLASLVAWLRGAGAAGAAAYVGVFIVAVVCMVPGVWIAAAGGFVYGPVVGVLLAWPAAVAGATASFVVGRFVARGWVSRRMAGNARFAAVDEAISRGGIKVLALLRLSPLPHNFLNYGMAITRARTRDYAAGTAIGLAPVCALFCYGGSLAGSAAELTSGAARARLGPWPYVLSGLGLVATVAVVYYVSRTAREALRRAMVEPAPAAPGGPPAPSP